jgi:hypothetical protein
MRTLLTGFGLGLLAGAAGTTALNLTTYGDMAVRGRPSSTAPENLVEKLAEGVGVDVPGAGEVRTNRLTGLAGVAGALTGVVVGGGAGLLRACGVRLPLLVAAPLIGLAAMTGADVPLAVTGVSDPRTWKPADWAADAVPHLVYGAVTAIALRALERRG